MERAKGENPLGYAPIGSLLRKFAIPAIISMVVNAVYNIVDQIFIGQGVGMLGNAATNVAFPLNTITTAMALLVGIGTASNFNLELGRGNRERAGHIAGTGVTCLVGIGIVLSLVVLTFLEPLMRAFGATDAVLDYALTYTGITAMGIPFVMFAQGGSHMIRADGSPTYSMISVVTGAVLNTALDPLFIFVFDMGIAGAAWATVIGQVVSGLLTASYFFRFKTVKLTRQYLRPRLDYFHSIAALGAASCVNQLAMTVTQIALNNVLTYYGASSVYGSEIPLACVGVISKVNMIFISVVVGVAQGCQPITSYNYGAKQYDRVKATYRRAVTLNTAIATVAFLLFQLFPRQIVSVFGEGSEAYFQFAVRYFRIFLALTFVNGIQPLTANFFTSIGKATRGMMISLTRQVLFLLPLVIIFPMLWGIDGVMYAGPLADGAAAAVAIVLVYREMRSMPDDPPDPAPDADPGQS